jgi:hypothetical protein
MRYGEAISFCYSSELAAGTRGEDFGEFNRYGKER